MARWSWFGPCLWLACCAAPKTVWAGWSTETIAEMRVDLYVPSAPKALLIALHGCTQDPDALRDRAHFEAPAEAHGAVVALPAVPNGGVIAGCWDYYGTDHALDSRHDRYVVALVDALVGAYAIDANQVYLIGISSGGGETAVMGCLAPDRFAGIGIVAGPAVGTDLSGFATISTDRETAVSVCRTLAGSSVAELATQVTSVIQGSDDFVVNSGYARLNAEIMAEVYRDGAALTESSLDVSALPGMSPAGMGSLWSDAGGPRVSLIVVEGMGHAFPAGSGDGLETSFVAQKGVDYPAYVLDFFDANNRRLDRPIPADGGFADGGFASRDGSVRDGAVATDGGKTGDSDASVEGCSCRASAARGEPMLLLLALFAFVRRRP